MSTSISIDSFRECELYGSIFTCSYFKMYGEECTIQEHANNNQELYYIASIFTKDARWAATVHTSLELG